MLYRYGSWLDMGRGIDNGVNIRELNRSSRHYAIRNMKRSERSEDQSEARCLSSAETTREVVQPTTIAITQRRTSRAMEATAGDNSTIWWILRLERATEWRTPTSEARSMRRDEEQTRMMLGVDPVMWSETHWPFSRGARDPRSPPDRRARPLFHG